MGQAPPQPVNLSAPARATLSRRARRTLLGALLAVYLTLGTLYALGTPAWQVPDEPAHYNYALYVAQTGHLPELRPGDYPAAYLEELKARRFAPELSIETIRYEAHQPPLYYLLAAGVLRLTQRLPLAPLYHLRLFSILLGGVAILLGYGVVRAIVPARPTLALATVTFFWTQPMHLTMTAAANNDVLVGLLINLVALELLISARWSYRRAALIGLLLGLAFITKMQSYVTLGMALVALGYDALLAPPRPRWALLCSRAALMFGLAALVALPWLARNVSVYGLGDPLALVRHDAVVQGQLTTAEYVAAHGWAALARGLLQTTFQSFWGQFGWMGVVLPPRVYQTLAALCLIGAAGLGWRIVYARRFGAIRRYRRAGLILLAWVVLTVAGYLWWNTRYLQHQGRYLFPALTPLALGLLLGIETLLDARPVPLWLGLGALAIGILAAGLISGHVPVYSLALVIGAAAALTLGQLAQRRAPGLPLMALMTLQGVWALICLYGYVIPALIP